MARALLLFALMAVAPRIAIAPTAAERDGRVLAAYGVVLTGVALLIAYSAWFIWDLGNKVENADAQIDKIDRKDAAADEPK
jgi:hypothetical protein